MQQPAWWALYIGLGLYALVAVSKIVTATMPDSVRRAMDDPTTVYFKSAEMQGRECRDMAEEAKQRGSTHWVCFR